jgi:amino acid transporter
MMEIEFHDPAAIEFHDPAAAYAYAYRRRNAIEGQVETDDETAARKQKEIRDQRRNNSADIKHAARRLDAARKDYHLASITTGVASVFDGGVIIGWVLALTWWFGMATNLGGRGGLLGFFFVFLSIFTIVGGIGSACSIEWMYETHKKLRNSRHEHEDALEAAANYEMELVE